MQYVGSSGVGDLDLVFGDLDPCSKPVQVSLLMWRLSQIIIIL